MCPALQYHSFESPHCSLHFTQRSAFPTGYLGECREQVKGTGNINKMTILMVSLQECQPDLFNRLEDVFFLELCKLYLRVTIN